MGTRIQKALGWGITGLNVDPAIDPYNPSDPRIDLSRLDQRSESQELTNEKWVSWLKSKLAQKESDSMDFLFYTLLLREAQSFTEKAKDEIIRNIIYEGEYGDPHTLLVIPPGAQDFRHSDDPIDYYQSYLEHESMESTVQMLNIGIYPWNVDYMRTDTGEKISEKARNLRSYLRDVQRSDKKKPHKDNDKVMRLLKKGIAEEIGFDGDFETVYDIMAPDVPLEVKELLAWSGILTSDDGWKEFRPMVYTWWG